MNKSKKLVLGIAAAGALLMFGLTLPVGATALRTLVLNVLTATTATITTLTATTGTIPTLTSSTSFKGPSVSTETITAAATITANACGGLKRITSTGDVTTGTTNTLTAPSTAGNCSMLIVNVGSGTIYLDSNSLFLVTSAASLPIGPNGSIQVVSDGTYWRHGAWTEY